MKRTLTIAGTLVALWSAPIHAQEPGDTALKLIGKAQAQFPQELADAISQQILADVDNRRSGSFKRSLATLFLADRFYKQLRVGRFEGAPTITWNGYDAADGRPTFLFEPGDFAYVTARGRRITPSTMDTDGGSVPKVLHSFGNFNPWTYGPAFMIHDWIFVAHKCDAAPDNDIAFEESASIMAEAMKTLMEVGFKNGDGEIQVLPKAEDTLYLMYQAVRSHFAEELWNETDNVQCR